MKGLIDKIEEDHPLFHDDGHGNMTSWNSNITLLRNVEKMIKPEMVTLEIGSGYSSVMFIANKCRHTSISPVKEESIRISTYCQDAGISLDDVKFLIGESHEILPTLAKDSFDVIFIDGAHRFPFPIVDWFFSSLLLKENGLVAIDDTDIISCHILLQFLANYSHCETVDIRENFGIFRKKGNHDYPLDWPGQIFSRQKIIEETDVLKAFYPENNWDEQTKQSQLAEIKSQLSSTQIELALTQSQLASTQSQLVSIKNQADSHAKELGAIYSSRLWKLGLIINKLEKILIPRRK